VDAELIDLRTLVPLDVATITASVEKTGRCVIVHEAPLTCGFGAEVVALIHQHCFWNLEAPVARVTGWDTPFPHGQEREYMPSRERISGAMRSAVAASIKFIVILREPQRPKDLRRRRRNSSLRSE